MPPKLYL
ncbi:hypothetical protein Ocin01_14005 [Orchesella cincta]|nr:hypothetical protein Ocin01_14005 [Orchesella cincta]